LKHENYIYWFVLESRNSVRSSDFTDMFHLKIVSKLDFCIVQNVNICDWRKCRILRSKTIVMTSISLDSPRGFFTKSCFFSTNFILMSCTEYFPSTLQSSCLSL
jgi:hypothetical protein